MKKKEILCILFLVGLLIPWINPFAYGNPPVCFNNVGQNFFQEELTSQAMSLYEVYQSQWATINNALRVKSRQLPFILANRAAKMSPNPLKPL